MNDELCVQMGVHELGLRKAILKGIDLQRPEAAKLTQKEKVSDSALLRLFLTRVVILSSSAGAREVSS